MKKKISVSLAVILTLVFTIVAFASNSMVVFSDTTVMVSGPLDEYQPLEDAEWGTAVPAVVTETSTVTAPATRWSS